MKSWISRLVMWAAALGLLVSSRGALADVTIVQDGEPRASIVVAKLAIEPAEDDAAAQKISAAAADLQEYVRKISGAELPIVADDAAPEGTLVLVGRSALTEATDAQIPSGLTPDRKEEGFVILAEGDRLLLAGNDEGPYHGTEYAVAHLLHTLGVRWYMPGQYGEYYPMQATITVEDTSQTHRPDFIQRNWWLHATPEMAALEKRWKIRNGMNPDNMWAIPGDSSVRNFVADAALVETQPELFALTHEGKRDPHLPNLTNPEAIRIAADKMKELIRKDNLASIGIAPDDGIPRDFNPETLKRHAGFVDVYAREGAAHEYSMSEEWFDFINAVAAQVTEEFPDVVITTNGYANRNLPPFGVELHPNLSVMFAAIWADTLHAHDDPKSWQAVRHGQMMKRWCELNPRVWLYGYNYTMLMSGLTPVPTVRRLARNFPLMKEWGVAGFIDEARNVWMEDGITRYVRARLEWDADADVEAILEEYYGHWYGKAAAPMGAFWGTLEEAMESTPYLMQDDRTLPLVYPPKLLARLKEHLEEGERLADDERSRGHVRVDRLIYEHLLDYVAMHEAEMAGQFTDAADRAAAMMEKRAELHAVNPFWAMPWERDEEHPGYESGVYYWGVRNREDWLRKVAERTGGDAGELVAWLPETAQFRVDPFDEGRFAGWYLPAEEMERYAIAKPIAKPDAPDGQPAADGAPPGGVGSGNSVVFDPGAPQADWRELLTTKPFFAQGYLDAEGHPYAGYMWYRLEVDVPAEAAGRPVRLFVPTVEIEAWAWVNGKYVGHRPYMEGYIRPQEFEVGVTNALEPGQKNLVVLRVATTTNRAMVPGGVRSRMFLYSPRSVAGAE